MWKSGEYKATLFLVSWRIFSLCCLSSPTLAAFMKRTRVHVCRSLRTGRVHAVHTMSDSCVYTHGPTRVRFSCRVAVWVEGTHGRRKQRIMVITVIKRQPLRTRPGSTWKIRCFTSECGDTIRRESPTTAKRNAGTLRVEKGRRCFGILRTTATLHTILG